MHLGTLIAVILYFRRTWAEMRGWFRELRVARSERRRARRLGWFSSSARSLAIFGFVFEDQIEGSPRAVPDRHRR